MNTTYEWIATAAFGLEGIVARELERLHIPAKAENGGARFTATLEDAMRGNLWLRCADRVLLVLAQDAADHTFRRARSFTQNGKPPMLRAPFTKEELGGALGCSACAMAAFTDVALALAFVQALDEPEHYAQLIQTLQTQVERVKKRRAEEKAHQKNVRQGKKKPSKV